MSLAKECPTGWREVPIGEVVRIDSQGIIPKEHSEQIFQYVGLENIESETGRIIGDLPTPGSEIGSRKYVFDERHVLYGRLRPYLNKTALPDFEGICSTDVLPLLPKPELVLRKYVAHYLRSPEFVAYADTRSSGTKMPRLGREQLRRVTIPLPPLPIQRRIVDILELADELGRKRAQADELAERIPSALFIKIFGNPVTNPMGWKAYSLDDILSLIRNGTTAEQNKEGKGYPVSRIETISHWKINPVKVGYVELDDEHFEKFRMYEGDILFSHINSVSHLGKTAIYRGVPKNLVHGMNLLLLRSDTDLCLPKYLLWALRNSSMLSQIRNRARRAVNQASVNHSDIKSLKLPVPPLEEQERFAIMCERIETQRQQQTQSRQRLEAAFETLLTRAFRGELTADLTLQEAFGFTDRQMTLLRILNGAAQIQEPVLVTSTMKYAFLFQTEGTRAGQPVERMAAERRAPYITEPAYDFVPYKYGPFAKELYDDLEALAASGLVRAEHPPKGKGTLREKTEIYLVQNQTDTIHDLVDSLSPKVRLAVDAVIGEYGNLSQNRLLDMVYRRYPEYTVNSEWKRGTFTKADE